KMEMRNKVSAKELSDTDCWVCGKRLPRSYGRGRKKETHVHCSQIGKLINWLDAAMEANAKYFDDEASVRISNIIASIGDIARVEPYVGDDQWIKKVFFDE